MAGPNSPIADDPRTQERFAATRDRLDPRIAPGDGAPPAEPHDRPRPAAGQPHGGDPHGHAPPEHDESAIPTDLPKPSNFTMLVVLGVIVLLLVGMFLIGYFPNRHREEQANADAKDVANRAPTVLVAMPQKSASAAELVFPADIHANQSTAIYTRATGFLKQWYVDIQDKVKAGQLLAQIESPDLDAQLQQSLATLEQDKANVQRSQADLKLADVTLKRYVEALKVSPGSVTQEQVDQERDAYDDAVSALAQARASVAQAQANVQQLQAQVSFERVVAPFDGVITTRNYDNGAFLAPPTAPNSTREIFDIAQTDLLRVFVSVPEPDSTAVQVGKPAYLTVGNYPDRRFQGVVARTSDSLDETTRTLTVELDFPNKTGELYPGMYGQAHIPVSDAQGNLLIPSGALLFNADGTTVAVVHDNKVHIQPVKVGRDFGTMLEITQGLTLNDPVVANPGEKLEEGLQVQVAKQSNGQPATGRPKSQGGASASG